MDLPLDIQSKIDELLDGYKLNELRDTFLAIQKAYKKLAKNYPEISGNFFCGQPPRKMGFMLK